VVQPAVVDAVGRSELFSGLSHDDWAAIAVQSRPRRFDKGQVVFTRGDDGDFMYIVAQGSIALSASTVDGGEVVMALVFPPQSFGELAIVDGGERTATATARQRTVLVQIPGSTVRQVLRDHPPVAMSMLKALSAMIRSIDDHMVDLVLVDLPGRVVKFLLAAASTSAASTVSGGWVSVDLRLNQTELSRLVGGSRQNVNRIIGSLADQGSIRRDGPRVVAVRPDLLASTLGIARSPWRGSGQV
jgi:CRP/FNR family cyclic AMP-dependent transcriptional regulator